MMFCCLCDVSIPYLQSAGSEVVDYLQYVCSNDINRPVGMVVHTGMQNQQGGYENDCSVVRLANNQYVLLSLIVVNFVCHFTLLSLVIKIDR